MSNSDRAAAALFLAQQQLDVARGAALAVAESLTLLNDTLVGLAARVDEAATALAAVEA